MKGILPFITVSTLLTAFLVGSCVKKPEYPSEPVIEYKDFLFYGPLADPDSVELVISFTDNEGDIGLYDSDTVGLFENGNLVMIYYYWDTAGPGEKWSIYRDPLTNDTLKFYYRVPLILPDSDKAQPTKGLIFAKQSPFVSPFNKIRFDVYLYDQALHRSNVITTPDIEF